LKILQKSLSQISTLDLSQYDVLIIIGPGSNLSGLDRLKTYVDNGGSILLIPGSNTSPQSFQQITSGLNIPSPTGTSGNINAAGNGIRFDKVDFNHPVFKDIFLMQLKRILNRRTFIIISKSILKAKAKAL